MNNVAPPLRSKAPSGYIREKWVALIVRAVVLASPVLAALYLISVYSVNDSVYLMRFGSPGEILYAVNGAAVLLTLSSFFVVTISLSWYIWNLFHEIFGLPVTSRLIRSLNLISFFCLILLLLALVLLVFAFVITASGGNVPGQQDLHQFSSLSRLFAIIVFGAFLLVDACLLVSQSAQIRLLRSSRVPMWRREILRKINGQRFGALSILLINIPMLCLAILAEWLNRQISSNSGYRVFFDFDGNFSTPFPVVTRETQYLFTNGLDAGIVAATVLLSQMVFFVLQTRWDYREYKLLRRGRPVTLPPQTRPGRGRLTRSITHSP